MARGEATGSASGTLFRAEASPPAPPSLEGPHVMGSDRIEGAGKQAKGAVKEVAGKVTGDEKLKAEGRADKVEGKVQNTVGGAKDKVRDTVDPDRT